MKPQRPGEEYPTDVKGGARRLQHHRLAAAEFIEGDVFDQVAVYANYAPEYIPAAVADHRAVPEAADCNADPHHNDNESQNTGVGGCNRDWHVETFVC